MTPRRRALLVMPPGPAREAVDRLLARTVDEVALAGDPFEATARFAETPAELVVASLSTWRRRDLGFLAAVRARRPHVAILALVSDARRPLVAAALAAGADGYLPEPVDLEALAAVVRRWLDRTAVTTPAETAPLSGLASQVGHAINNPLQVISLLLEDPAVADPRFARARDGLRAEVARIRDAVDIVAAFGRLSAPAPAPVDLGALVLDGWGRWARTGLTVPPPPAIPHRADAPAVAVVEALADAAHLREALDAIVRFVAMAAPRRPVALRVVARASTADRGQGVEVAVRAEGVVLAPGRVDAARAAVLEVDEASRVPYPGLALPSAVARAHGGHLVVRRSRQGSVVVLRVPGRVR